MKWFKDIFVYVKNVKVERIAAEDVKKLIGQCVTVQTVCNEIHYQSCYTSNNCNYY